MADSVILVRRNTPPEGFTTESVDVLANKQAAPNAGYYLWTVQGILVSQTDAQVQTTLNGMVATVITAIVANGEIPLTAEQLSDYQNLIDLQTLQQWLDNLKNDLDEITTASNVTGAPTGLKDAFSNQAQFTALSNANKFELIRAGINNMLGYQVDTMKSVRILLKRAKRLGG